MLKLRKVDLLGFKSFCEKTHITFSGSGVTCIVGPNGCGKSNIVDAISWVLGEQSHKALRAERMADCIFNGTAKRPPLGLAEVSLTLVDPELAEAAAMVLAVVEETPAENPTETIEGDAAGDEASEASAEVPPEEAATNLKPWKRKAEKPAIHVKPGEVVIGRRLYRSGQSEYLINGRVARLRDVQELFMGMGLGPDSYAIIEQGRIGQILNSKPMDRRAIIEEAAGVTMFKTKKRLAEAKLEASKVNLARVSDILVEVEKQLASLKRQASKARRYAELREQMRGLIRAVIASKAQQLDAEAERLEDILRGMIAEESGAAEALRTLEGEQERLAARTYELDGELRSTQNLLGQAALELDRAENRITFNREQMTQADTRAIRLGAESDEAARQIAEIEARAKAHRESVIALRVQTTELEATLKNSLDQVVAAASERDALEARIEELRQSAIHLGEEAVRAQADAEQAAETQERTAGVLAERETARKKIEIACAEQAERARIAVAKFGEAEAAARELARTLQEARGELGALRENHESTARELGLAREQLSAAHGRRGSLEQILNERAYTAEAVQKLFSVNGEGETKSRGFHAVGVLADYAEVEEQYENAVEQFLRDELEYVVVETFDHARAGIALLRDEMGGRATFFVDSLRQLSWKPDETPVPFSAEPGFISRMDRLVNFRDPLGAAAKHFLPKLHSAFLVETPVIAEKLAREYPQHHFITLEGTYYHGRIVSGGRPGDAGPLALKRELRALEAESARLERRLEETQSEMTRLADALRGAELRIAETQALHVEAEKALVAATLQREQARAELARLEEQVAECRREISGVEAEAAAARERQQTAHKMHEDSLAAREAVESEALGATERLNAMRTQMHVEQEQLVARREELAAISERLGSAETSEKRLAEELLAGRERQGAIEEQRAAIEREQTELKSSTTEHERLVMNFREEKARLQKKMSQLEEEWQGARNRSANLEESLRQKRLRLDDVRAERGQREIEKARNDADRDYLRQTCVSETNLQPEELLAQETQMLTAEELAAAETNYAEMKSRMETMGPVNMMALEEYQECEQRNEFLTRERDDLVQSIENTQQAISELDEVSRKKFEEAFAAINLNFAEAFRVLFGGGTGEMRLTEPDSSGDAGIDVVAQPPGKRLQNVMLLSGGEKAMTALALLIAIFRYQPSPFCILDEVDAPLDEANVGRFTKMLNDMSAQTQFIIVTHNRKTMELGSMLYGVTMQEPGVSRLVSVRWEEAAEIPSAKVATNAA
ncbi:MAG: chromosome segregation protein SMC [Candidatus Acidiferrales bacterium]